MADQMSGPITRCQWCSAELPAPDPECCPSCGAKLASAAGTEPQLPGVTTVDPEAILKAGSEAARPGSRILSFLTGDVSSSRTDGPVDSAPFAPPSDEVRREMFRLQIEAERGDIGAETVALKADAPAQDGIHVSEPGASEPAAPAGDADPAGEAGLTDAGDTGPATRA
jgi:hypothetical protein